MHVETRKTDSFGSERLALIIAVMVALLSMFFKSLYKMNRKDD